MSHYFYISENKIVLENLPVLKEGEVSIAA